MINVTKGWPNSHGSEDSYPVLVGQDIVEGDFVLLVDDGAGNPVYRLLLSTDIDAGIVDSMAGQALDTNTSFGYDVRYTGMLPVVKNNYTAQTDRYGAGTYAPGTKLMIDVARPGTVIPWVSGPVIGVVISIDTESGVLKLTRR